MSAGVHTPAPATPLLRSEFAPTRVWTPLEHEVVNPADKEAVAWLCQLLVCRARSKLPEGSER